MDLLRSVEVRLGQDAKIAAMAAKWRESIPPAIDDMQLELESSEIYVVFALYTYRDRSWSSPTPGTAAS